LHFFDFILIETLILGHDIITTNESVFQ
jgi:hypothetical protein